MIQYVPFDMNNLLQFSTIKQLIDKDLSEPYSIWVYRYFLNQWPELVYLAYDDSTSGENGVGSSGIDVQRDRPIGCIVSKIDTHRKCRRRGYIGMLTVNKEYRGQGIAKKLIELTIEAMINDQCDEIMLETEVENTVALHLYEKMGFIKMKRMFRYYLNEGDAFKLILPLTSKSCIRSTFLYNPNEIA